MTESQTTAFEHHLASLSDAELIGIWEAVDGDPTEEQVLALGEVEWCNTDL